MRLRNLGFDVFVFLPVSAKGLNSGQKRWREWCGQASANSGVGNDVISGKIAIFVYRNEIIDMNELDIPEVVLKELIKYPSY